MKVKGENRLVQPLVEAIKTVASQPVFAVAGEDKVCQYRFSPEKDTMVCCVVGALIKDEHYEYFFEGEGASDGPITEAVKVSLGFKNDLTGPEVTVLRYLQRIHDDMAKCRGTTPAGFIAEVLRHDPTDEGELPEGTWQDIMLAIQGYLKEISNEH